MSPQLKTTHTHFLLVLFFCVCLLPITSAWSQTESYEDLLDHRTGFGRNVTGGAGGDVVIIDTLDYSVLKAALTSADPKWIRFAPGLTGAVEVEGNLFIKSNKTIDGRGANITLTSPDDGDEILLWNGRHNLIVHNIKIDQVGDGDNSGQGLGLAFGAHDVWVDHVTFSRNGDESFSMGKGATDATVSWSRFVNTDKGILLGWGPNDEIQDQSMRATITHNYFWRVNGRAPQFTSGKVHYLNNYADEWNWSSANVTTNGQLYSEKNIYDRGRWANSPAAITTEADEYHPKPGFAKTVGDVFNDPNPALHTSGPGVNVGGVTFDPAESYGYIPEAPDSLLQSNLSQFTGWSANPQWPGESVTALGDFDADVDVDGADFLKWQSRDSLDPLNLVDLEAWQADFPNSSSQLAAVVPEPASSVLLIMYLSFLPLRHSRKKI